LSWTRLLTEQEFAVLSHDYHAGQVSMLNNPGHLYRLTRAWFRARVGRQLRPHDDHARDDHLGRPEVGAHGVALQGAPPCCKDRLASSLAIFARGRTYVPGSPGTFYEPFTNLCRGPLRRKWSGSVAVRTLGDRTEAARFDTLNRDHPDPLNQDHPRAAMMAGQALPAHPLSAFRRLGRPVFTRVLGGPTRRAVR
jgi:hypothetical protein